MISVMFLFNLFEKFFNLQPKLKLIISNIMSNIKILEYLIIILYKAEIAGNSKMLLI